MLNYYEDQILKLTTLPQDVVFDKSKEAGLHQLKFVNVSKDEKLIDTPTVMIHGHAASGIFYHRNFNDLSSKIKELYTIDLPGISLSDAEPFKTPKLEKSKLELKVSQDKQELHYSIKQNNGKIKRNVEQVSKYYIDAIEKWRKANGLEKFNMISHSFGGYLSFRYALQHPERVSKLLFVSPAGVEKSIFSINNTKKEGIISNEPYLENYYRPPLIPKIISTFGFNLTRIMGPLGVKLISKYLSIRYSRGSELDDPRILMLIKYTINLFHQRNDSYDHLQTLLNNQVIAFDPILDHIEELKMPVHFMYGQYDWMNPKAGFFAGAKAHNGHFKVIKNAGHNIFLDNPHDFNEETINFLRG